MDLSDTETTPAILSKHADLKQEDHEKKKKKDKKHKKDKKKHRDIPDSHELKNMSEEQLNALLAKYTAKGEEEIEQIDSKVTKGT